MSDPLQQLASMLGYPRDCSTWEELNRWWRGLARQASARQFRSPLYHRRRPLPGGQALYSYERTLWPTPLETDPGPLAGWRAESCLARNSQAAWSCLLAVLRNLIERPMLVRCWQMGDELDPLLDALAPARWSKAFRLATLHSSMEERRAEVFVIRARHWEVSQVRGTGVVVLDLEDGVDFPLERFLANTQAWMVVTVRRYSWRDSYGLQLSWPALLQLWTPPDDRPGESGLSVLDTASELVRRARSVMGGAPTYEQLWQWTLPRWDYRPEYAVETPSETSPPMFSEGETPSGTSPPWIGGWPSPPVLSAPEGRWLKAMARWRRATLRRADAGLAPPLPELEQRLLAYDEVPGDWSLRPMLFSSAMAALSAILLSWPAPQSSARYFETQFLQALLGANEGPAYLMESVQYDWELQPWDGSFPHSPGVLVVDTTLTGQRLRIPHILEVYRPQLLVRVFSALKLDQRGQELENLGAVLLAGPPPVVDEAYASLIGLRSAMGTLPDSGRLSPPWLLQPHDGHAEAVLENNRWLAHSLSPGGLLERVVHPSLGPHRSQPWACAPFVVLHGEDPGWICAALGREARRLGLPLHQGASFGFVDHRYEAIVPTLKDQRILFKVALGSSGGPSREGVLEALKRVYSHPNLASLKQAYPGLRRARPVQDWAAPSPRLLRFLAGS